MLCRTMQVASAALPIIWDADVLFGPKCGDGTDTYVLCRIKVSGVFLFPDSALPALAGLTHARLADGA